MADTPADESKQPPECKALMSKTGCKNCDTTYEGMDGESWECKVCGLRFKLYYEDMA